MADQCIPPPEHDHVEFHWLRLEYPGMAQPIRFKPFAWAGRGIDKWEWTGGMGFISPETAAHCGWHYVGPALPPNVS